MNKPAREFMIKTRMKNLMPVKYLGIELVKFPGLVSVSHIDPVLTFRMEDSRPSP